MKNHKNTRRLWHQNLALLLNTSRQSLKWVKELKCKIILQRDSLAHNTEVPNSPETKEKYTNEKRKRKERFAERYQERGLVQLAALNTGASLHWRCLNETEKGFFSKNKKAHHKTTKEKRTVKNVKGGKHNKQTYQRTKK